MVMTFLPLRWYTSSALNFVQRTFLKDSSTNKNIPIQAIGLSLYEALPGTTAEQIGNEVIRTQWLSVFSLLDREMPRIPNSQGT